MVGQHKIVALHTIVALSSSEWYLKKKTKGGITNPTPYFSNTSDTFHFTIPNCYTIKDFLKVSILWQNLITNPKGHWFPDLGIDETRSRSWKTLLLAPAALIVTAYNPESPDTEDPTAIWNRWMKVVRERTLRNQVNISSLNLQNLEDELNV